MRFRVAHLLTLTAFIALLASCAVVNNGFWQRFLPFACSFYIFSRIEPRPESTADVRQSLYKFLLQLFRGITIATLTALVVMLLMGSPRPPDVFYNFPSLVMFALVGGALGAYWSRDAQKE
jgi:hypothetical protein